MGKRLLAILLCLSTPSWGVVALVNSNTAAADPSSGGSLTFTATSGTNLACFAFFEWDGAGASDNISGVTWAGASMTAVGATAKNSSLTSFNKSFYIANPTTGSGSLTFTMTGASEFYAAMDCYSGVDQTTPVRFGTYQNTTNASGANPTLTIISNTSDLTTTNISDGTGLSATNQTQNYMNNGGILEMYGDRATTAAATVTHTWTMGSGAYNMLGFSICASGTSCSGAVAAPPLSQLSINGGKVSIRGGKVTIK